MAQEKLKQAIKDKLNVYDKDALVDIMADVCLMYVRTFTDMSNINCTQQCVNNIQEVDDFTTQRINNSLYGK